MTELTYTPLHLHSDASIMDGLGTIERMVHRAKILGLTQLAISDHGTHANAISFQIACERAGIKPIFGLEGYLAVDGNVGHITLLADGDRGFANLVRLNNLGHKSTYRQPAFTVDQLLAHSDAVVLLTGCISSPLQKMPLGEALRLGSLLKGHFGSRMFSEIQFSTAGGDQPGRAIELSKSLGIRLVPTGDVHFSYSGDAGTHRILTQMKAGFTYEGDHLWLKPANQMLKDAQTFGFTEAEALEMLQRTQLIGQLLHVPNLKHSPELPKIEGAHAKLHFLVDERLRDLGLRGSELRAYDERVKRELDVIGKMGFSSYFLILLDIVGASKERGIPIGPGRGSGAGSLVLYLLGITEIDPIHYGLSFERFLNPTRASMPDVDVDFASDRRQEVLEIAHEQYGAVPIATYSNFSHKSLTRDLGRYFGIKKSLVDEAAEKGKGSAAFSTMCSENDGLLKAYNVMLGQKRHKGRHAGGVVIADKSRAIPVERLSGDDLGVAWTEGMDSELSYAGLVKFDLLGLSVLSALEEMRVSTGASCPIEPYKYTGVWKLFEDGDLSGIFQFSGSPGIRELTMRLKPKSIEDLAVINALWRPGPIDAGITEKYHEYLESPRHIPECVEHIVHDTHGVPIYQEQIMAIVAAVMGGDMVQADNARRIISKPKPDNEKWVAEIESLKKKFLEGAATMMRFKETLALWNDVVSFSGYGFNKSHSIAYSTISWRCAWYKYHFPASFYAAMMNHDPDNRQTYVFDALSAGLSVRRPKVLESKPLAFRGSETTKTIYFPLASVKWLGENGAHEIERVRSGFGRTGWTKADFLEHISKRLLNSRARTALYFLGAFDGIDGPEEDLELGKSADAARGLSESDLELTYLGFRIPTEKLIEAKKRYEGDGVIVGIVDTIKEKTSRYGPYRVFYMSPSGVFWSRNMDAYKEGDVLAVRVHSGSGKALRVKTIES